MTKESLAEQLNGREYRDEITKDEEVQAKDAGLLVVFGYSDDNTEFRGAVNDELGAYEGGEYLLHHGGVLPKDEDHRCDCNYCGYEAKAERCLTLSAVWQSGGYAWIYKTKVPHATFDIMEDGEKYCRGIVIDMKDLPPLS